MATWMEFENDAPDIAAAGRQMLYQFGVGLALLATLRKDGAPRLHPICPDHRRRPPLCAHRADAQTRRPPARDGR